MPRTIAAVLAGSPNKTATLRDLEEYLSVEDVYDLLEVAMVDAHNEKRRREFAERSQ